MALRGRRWRALLPGGRRTPWINGGLVVLLVLAVVVAFTVIGNPSAPPVPVRTAVVTRGDVTATVTGSGNAASAISMPVSFGTDGTVTAINVKPGDTVALGQVLATVDPAASQEGVRTAQAALDGARAAYDQAANGPTAVQKQQDQQAITAAQEGVDNANAAVQNARDQLALDTKSLATGVSNARTQLANDRASTATTIKTARVQLSTDTTAQNTAVTNARTTESTACGPVLEAYAVPLTTAPTASRSAASVTTVPTTTRTTTTRTTTTQPTTTRTTTATQTSTPTSTVTSPTTSRSSTPTTSTTVGTGTTGTGTTPATGTTAGAATSPSTSAATSTSSASSCTSAKQAVTTAEENRSAVLQKDQLAITSAEQAQNATLDKDQQAITAAQQTQSDTLLKDNQAIQTNQQGVTTAQNQVKSAQLTAEADLHPQTPAQIAQARANVDSAQVQVDSAQRALDGTVLKAPQAGVVLAVNGKVGESSSGGSGSTGSSTSSTSSGTTGNASSASSATSSAGTGFITIANPSQLDVTADIAEADAAGIQLGQQATVTFPATNGTATGTVTQITPQSTVTNNVVLYPITVSLDTAPPGVKSGSTASLAITDGTATGVLEVPTAAITTVGTSHTVTVRRNGTDTVVPVGVGLTGATTTEITSGLAAGDVLVLPSPTTSTTPTTGGGFPRLGGGR